MPQEKFITRKQAGIKEMPQPYRNRGAEPFHMYTKAGSKANEKMWNKTYGNAGAKYSEVYFNPDHDYFLKNIEDAKIARDDARLKANAKAKAAEIKTDNKVVAKRDATNARIARERLASRATNKAGERPVVDTFDANKNKIKNAPNMGVLNNPMLGVAAAIADADKATGYKRAKYTGNFGGPSFSANPYSSKTSYAGQSPMSKMMGVGKKGK